MKFRARKPHFIKDGCKNRAKPRSKEGENHGA